MEDREARRALTGACLVAAERSWTEATRQDGSIRIFEHRWLDALTRCPVATPYVLAGVPAFGLLVWGALALPPLATASWFFSGWIGWTLVEYLMHRFFFHMPRTTEGKRVAAFLVHGHHHVYPNDLSRLAATPLQLGCLVGLVYGLGALVLDGSALHVFVAGFLAGYVFYEAVHFISHHGKPRTRLFKALKRHHLHHHHTNDSARWGISTPLWDVVFRTLR